MVKGLKINVVAFLIDHDIWNRLEKESPRLDDLREELLGVFIHSRDEIVPSKKLTNEDVCKKLKDKIFHHLAIKDWSRFGVENYSSLVKRVVVFSGLEVERPPREWDATTLVLGIPPTSGWGMQIFAFWFPYYEVSYDPPSEHWLFKDL